MALLDKLADCLSILGRQHRVSPAIRHEIFPTAAPDQAFGWQGNLNANFYVAGAVQAANFEWAALTITEDCFYALDATIFFQHNVTGPRTMRYRLQVIDIQGQVAWELWYNKLVGAGVFTLPGFQPPTLYMHLLKDMKVRWLGNDATTVNDFDAGSLALRKLYQDQL